MTLLHFLHNKNTFFNKAKHSWQWYNDSIVPLDSLPCLSNVTLDFKDAICMIANVLSALLVKHIRKCIQLYLHDVLWFSLSV